jgi:hypothetical protein
MHLNLGAVPEWFGGLSLLLAFAVFGTDRRNQARAQVDQVGIWVEAWEVPPEDLPEEAVTVVTEVKAVNASTLPVRIRRIEYELELTWVTITGDFVPLTSEVAIEMHRAKFISPGSLVKPGEDYSNPLPHDFEKPAGADRIGTINAGISLAVIADNAGRTWAVTGKGRAKRWRDWHNLRIARRTRRAIDRVRTRWWLRHVKPTPPEVLSGPPGMTGRSPGT